MIQRARRRERPRPRHLAFTLNRPYPMSRQFGLVRIETPTLADAAAPSS